MRTRVHFTWIALAALLAGGALPAVAGASSEPIVYVPATPRGAPSPASRVSAGTRGGARAAPLELVVLCPESDGLTLSSQPVLYWHISAPTSGRMTFTVIEDAAIHPILEVTVEGPRRAGVQRIALAEYGARLEIGPRYRWYVSVAREPGGEEHLAGGSIERVTSPAGLTRDLAKAPSASRPAILMESGIWYDGLDSLSRRIDADPGDTLLRAQRAALLGQVGLERTAALERSALAGP